MLLLLLLSVLLVPLHQRLNTQSQTSIYQSSFDLVFALWPCCWSSVVFWTAPWPQGQRVNFAFVWLCQPLQASPRSWACCQFDSARPADVLTVKLFHLSDCSRALDWCLFISRSLLCCASIAPLLSCWLFDLKTNQTCLVQMYRFDMHVFFQSCSYIICCLAPSTAFVLQIFAKFQQNYVIYCKHKVFQACKYSRHGYYHHYNWGVRFLPHIWGTLLWGWGYYGGIMGVFYVAVVCSYIKHISRDV